MINNTYQMGKPQQQQTNPKNGLQKPVKYKKKLSLESRVNKIANKFMKHKDVHYCDRLNNLQSNLTTMHQGNNVEYLRKVRDLEEERDMNLVGLRFFEEYRVSRSSIEFDQDIEQLKQEHENLVTLCKKRLFQQIEYKMKILQEEKLLMDVANAHTYSMDYSNVQVGAQHGMITRNSRHLTRGESARLSGEGSDYNSTMTSGHIINNSTTGMEFVANSGVLESGYSSTDKTGTPWHESGSSADDAATNGSNGKESVGVNGPILQGMSRRSLRRRVTTKQAERMTRDQETDGGKERNGAFGDSRVYRSRNNKDGHAESLGKADNEPELSGEWLKLVTDNSQLHSLLFGTTEEELQKSLYPDFYGGNGALHQTGSSSSTKKRNVGRHSTKSAPPLQSLSKDEVTDDINYLRALLKQGPSPFASSTSSTS